MRISDWSSDVCSSDLAGAGALGAGRAQVEIELGVEVAAGDRGQQAAAVDDGELAVGPDVMQAGRRRVQAEARGRTAGESERKRAVGAGGGGRQVRARCPVEGAFVAGTRRLEV